VLFLLLAACSTSPPAADEPAPEPEAVEPEAADAGVPVAYPRPTTKGDLALANLDKRIETLHGLIGDQPKTQIQLVEARSLRMTLRGTVEDLDAMLALATEPDAKARALLAAHRFDEALELDPEVADSVALARHERLDELETERRAAAEKYGNSTSWMRLADVLAAQGKTAEADEAYWKALDTYKDVSPLTVADIQFRRGVLWGDSGEDPERARALYEDAVKHLPQFVRAHTHLAEVERDAGDEEAAIARVQRNADAQDPEPGGKLATWLEGETAAEWKAKTIERYDALLKKHPLAFADHAAEFFLSIDDKARAAELAKANLDNRDTPRARDLCERAGCL
jgi:tetratricopeptide (TPR) repeat protein